MNSSLLSFLISAGLSLLQAPLELNFRDRDSAIDHRSYGKSVEAFPGWKNGCRSSRLMFGQIEMKVTNRPRGSCKSCCPVNLSSDVKFILHNKNTDRSGSTIVPFDQSGSVGNAGLDPKWDTVIYVHGFSETSPGPSGSAIVEAYRSRPEPYNVILLDWSELTTLPWYHAAVDNVPLVGELLQRFIRLHVQTGELSLKRLHVIGFSLGAHVASIAGKGLRNAGLKLPRITALDPAFPEFVRTDNSRRLFRTDADYIDVIHTDGGVFGYPDPIGHADFYPNGGRGIQPGCQPSDLIKRNVIEQVVSCSHTLAWRLYAESVRNPRAFPATRCQIWKEKGCDFTLDTFMGFLNRKSYGQFYLLTRQKSPYGLNAGEQVKKARTLKGF